MGTVRPVCMPQWEFIVCWLVSSVSWGVSPPSSEDCGVGYLRIGVGVQKKTRIYLRRAEANSQPVNLVLMLSSEMALLRLNSFRLYCSMMT